MIRYRSETRGDSIISCGCFLLVLVLNLLIGGWSVNYLLDFFIVKTIPTIGATLIGMIIGEITIPAAVVIAILRWFGVM